MSRDLEARVRRANLLSRDEQLEMLFGEDLSPLLLGRIRDLEEGRMTETTTGEQYPGGEPVIERAGIDDSPISAPRKTAQGGLRRLRPVTLVALLVLFAGVPVGMFLADRSPTPVEIAEAYIEARNAYDAEAARSLVAVDFRTTEPPDGFVDAEGMEVAFQQHEAYGFHYGDVDCSVAEEVSAGVRVECDYLWATELHRITNHEATPERLTFVIEDARIQVVLRSPGDISVLWDQWLDFLRDEHPDFYSVVVFALRNDPESTRDLVEGLPEHLELFRAWVESQEG